MFKIKKKPEAKKKLPALYNIIEDYTEHDAPGNVTLCAMTEPEHVAAHAEVLSESYGVPLETMTTLLNDGGLYLFPAMGTVATRGMFVCHRDPTGVPPKMTFVLDVMQQAEAEQLSRSWGVPMPEAAVRVFVRGLADELQPRLREKNLGLDYTKLDRVVARGGDVKYVDFRKDWSVHFKRYCIMPDGRLVETGGIAEFAELHAITPEQARTLIDEGGTLDLPNGEVLACQVVNNQPSVARFNAKHYAKARDLMATRKLHVMDALSEVAFHDPLLMRALDKLERTLPKERK